MELSPRPLGQGIHLFTGSFVLGVPTGGNQGTGTLNATGLFVNGVAVSTSVGANPSASLGLAAVNGAATTWMRSDAAPALSQAIAPTWSALHTFTGGVDINTVGLIVGAATGGNEGAGTVNVSSGYYVNGTLQGNQTGPAAPGTSITLAQQNGAATTWMRSDAAPALSQAIAPTWSALHIFQGGVEVGAPTGGNKGANTINSPIANTYLDGTVFQGIAPTWTALHTFTGGVDINTVGLIVGAATGGNEGAGTVNVSSGYYVNGTLQGNQTGPAAPGTSITLAQQNGSATTWMRSDAAPALNQGIAPTWTATHIFNASVSPCLIAEWNSGTTSQTSTQHDAGYLDMPQATHSSSFTVAASERGKSIYLNGTTSTVCTLPNGTWPTGGTAVIINESGGSWTVSSATASNLTWEPSGTVATSRTLANHGVMTVYCQAGGAAFLGWGIGIS